MGRRCTVCSHSDRSGIEQRLVHGVTFRRLAEGFNVSEQALRRHRAKCLVPEIVQAAKLERLDHAGDLLEQARALQRETLAVLVEAKRTGNHGGVLQAVDRAQRGIALFATVLDRMGAPEDREIVIRWEGTSPVTSRS